MFNLAMFEQCRGGRFRIAAPDGSAGVDAHLIEVRSLGPPRKAPTEVVEPFSVVFRGPPRYLPQQIYRVSHEKLGDMELFLVPIGPDEQGMRFEAVFG